MLYFVFCLLLQLQIGIKVSAHVQVWQEGQRFRVVALIPLKRPQRQHGDV